MRIGFPQVRATLVRCRRLRSRPIPNSLLDLQNPRWEELGRTLAEDGVGQTFFRGVIGPGGQDGWHAAVYLSSRLQAGLINTRRVHLDATYKVLPVQLGAHLQLLTAHAEYLNQFNASYYDDFTANALYCPLFPVAFVIMTRKTQIGYEGVLQYLKRLVPQWELEVVMVDFETAYRNAASLVWPHANLVEVYLVYMRITWMRSVGPNTFSVFGQSHRTNNALEGCYSLLLRRMGPHPGVWAFNVELRKIESSQWLDYRRISDGFLHVGPTRRAYRRQDSAIHVASEQLMLGQCNVAQFLDRIALGPAESSGSGETTGCACHAALLIILTFLLTNPFSKPFIINETRRSGSGETFGCAWQPG
ncbi:hypothetical protein J6590_063140 [Homalodisca vitripennis]|nr:hypothetical protein J6590_063140 [Homalodisca vitripennis]